MLGRTILLQMAGNHRLESMVRHTAWTARAARRFVAGEILEEITAPVRALNAQGITATLDLLGESVHNEAMVAKTVDDHLRLLAQIRTEQLNANVSLKLTALGLDIDEELCYHNLVCILTAAGPDQFVRIDMEGSPYTQRTLDLFYRLWNSEHAFRNVGVVIQAYLYRSAEDIERLIRDGVRVRLCKGAYKEPAEVAYPQKSDVDANYVRLMQRLLKDGNYPGIATHDPAMIQATVDYARQNSIGSERFEFQMLYGIRRDLQLENVKQGWRQRVYVPYGDHWYPYFMRRLAERPANVWFVLKNLFKS